MIRDGRRAAASTMHETVTVRRRYRTSLEAAYNAWVNPRSLAMWFGPKGYRAEVLDHELRVGGRWRFRMSDDAGESFHHFGSFVEISPPNRLVFTWASEEQVEGWRDAEGNPTLVTVDFTATGDGVEVRVTHERLQSDPARRALAVGWGGSLDAMADFLEAGPENHETV